MVFTDAELHYLASQPLGRLATSQPDGTLQVSPVGFHYNSRTGTIDIAGHSMATSRKFRNVADNGRVAFVVDDLASVTPWRPRMLEIRGHAEALTTPTDSVYVDPSSGFDGAIIRIHPHRVLSFAVNDPTGDVQSLKIHTRDVG
ncbi:PPOX class F420-dependent oxidoreductase [Nocardia sp. NPDC004151]|uniref:PPOX class F420-dependent oxidoreductase n=1 Tax=Nocardia sp. NPDC004151 TaxID=3364304 RepID=UPI0036ABBED5